MNVLNKMSPTLNDLLSNPATMSIKKEESITCAEDGASLDVFHYTFSQALRAITFSVETINFTTKDNLGKKHTKS